MNQPTVNHQTTNSDSGAPHRRSRRLFRWLVAVLAVVVIAPLAVIGYRYQQQMALFDRLGGSIYETEPRGPAWLRSLMGDRMRGFDDIVEIFGLNQATTGDMQLLSRHPLRKLLLCNTTLNQSGTRYLGEMQDLQLLEFGLNSPISERVLNEIATIKNLQELRITDRSGGLPNIRDQKVQQLLNEILGASETGLKTRATETIASASLKPLQQSSQLRSLKIENKILTEIDLAEVGKLKQLESLDLDWCTIPDEGMQHLAALPNLKSLSLTWTTVTDAGVRHLYGHPALKSLEIQSTSVTEEEAQRLKEQLPGCEVYDKYFTPE